MNNDNKMDKIDEMIEDTGTVTAAESGASETPETQETQEPSVSQTVIEAVPADAAPQPQYVYTGQPTATPQPQVVVDPKTGQPAYLMPDGRLAAIQNCQPYVYIDQRTGYPVNYGQPAVVPAFKPDAPKPENPLSKTVKTKEAVKPFRKAANRFGFAICLYVLISLVAQIIMTIIPYIPHIPGILNDASVAEAVHSGQTWSIAAAISGYMSTRIDPIFRLNWQYISIVVSAALASTIPFIICAKKNGFNPLSSFGKGTGYKNKIFIKGVTLTFGATIVWSYTYTLLKMFFPSLESSQFGMELPTESPLAMGLFVFYTVIFAPLFEEFMFRGVLLKSLSKYGPLFSAFASALMFGLAHKNLQQTPFAFVAGLIFAYVAIKTGNIWTSVLIHFCINLFSTGTTMVMTLVDNQLLIGLYSIFMLLLYMSAVIGAIVILCVDGKKISWSVEAGDNNSAILPVAKEQPKAKWFNFLSAVAVIIAICYFAYEFYASIGR